MSARTCANCGNVEAHEARFCSRCGHELATDRGRERRALVSIVFCDLAGSTALGERLDPEVLRSVQERYFAASGMALRAHGGQIEKYIGDAVMCVFGLPAAREDDALRAVRGALDLVAAVADLNVELRTHLGVELSVRVGVNTGEVVAGDHARGQALVTGDAVNVAARLEQAAPPGAILIGELTHRLVSTHVTSEAVPAVDAKGKSQPLKAWRALAAASTSVARPGTRALVGRAEELAALKAAFARVASGGRTELVLLAGEAGIGKSRLAAELACATALRAVSGACPSYGRGNTYQPLRDVVETVAPTRTREELASVLGAQPNREVTARNLLRLVGGDSGPVTRVEAFAAVAHLLAALSTETPLVFVVEDLHWAEPTFLDLLQFLAESLASPVLIVATTRDELPALHGTVIRVQRLPDDAAAELVLLAGGHDPARLPELVARAGGNPLFLEQLAAWLAEGQAGVPPDLAGLISARLDLLDAEQRGVLEAAAVVGRDFLLDAVARLASADVGDDLARAMADLEQRGLVRHGASTAVPEPTGLSGIFGRQRFHFAHILVFEAVLAAMPKTRRAHLHESFAADLEHRESDAPAVVGYHLEQAALLRMELRPRAPLPQVAADAATHLERAGLQALEHGDAAAAGTLLSRARDLLPATPHPSPVQDASQLAHAHRQPLEDDELTPGTELGGYIIESTAGRGGMAIVYRAHDPELERSVAVKVIAPEFAGQFMFRERFVRESRMAAGIDHPSVIPVFRAGEDRGRLFIAMRYLNGGDLAQRLRERGPLAPDEAARCVHDIALALDAAHTRGLVHRDVKPANMMLDDANARRVYLTDFGLSIDQRGASDLTRPGQWVGTVAYSAPEQIRGAAADARADVYALGGVLHHLLTGQVPYPSASELDALAAHLTEPPPRPSKTQPAVPRAFDAVVARAMSKDPNLRFASAGDLGRAAVAAARGDGAPREHGSVATGNAAPGASTPSEPRRATPQAAERGHIVWIAATLVPLAVVAAVAAILVTLSSSPSTPSNPAGKLVGKAIALPARPDRISATGAAVWALGTTGAAIERIDAGTRAIRAIDEPFILGGGGGFADITASQGSVWVVHGSPTLGGVDRVADSRGRGPVHAALNDASAAAIDGDSVWVVSNPGGSHLGSLVRVNAATGAVRSRLPGIGRGATQIVVDRTGIWIVLRRDASVVRVDPKSMKVVARVRVGPAPDRLAIAGGSVWVLNSGDHTITRIGTADNIVRGAPIALGKDIQDVISAGGSPWFAASDRTLTRLNAATGKIVGAPIPVGAAPLALAAVGGTIWVASAGDNTLQRIAAA